MAAMPPAVPESLMNLRRAMRAIVASRHCVVRLEANAFRIGVRESEPSESFEEPREESGSYAK
jgi:hypothetical protein